MYNKKVLRNTALIERYAIDKKEHYTNTTDIVNRIISWSVFKKAHTILSYMPIQNEVDLVPLSEQIIQFNKELLLPKCSEDNKINLEIYRIYNIKNDLVSGKYDINEPYKKENIYTGKIDLVLVPGVAFDKNGGRIGYGAGYFDFLLSKLEDTIFAGICFDSQIYDNIELDKFDIMMDYIITEKQIIKTGARD